MVDGPSRRSKPISDYTDQSGNPVSREQMFKMVSENMLANVIAFEAAGVPLKELKQAVGRDGETVIGRGAVLQTPIAQRFSERDTTLLLETYSKFVGHYNAGWLDQQRIDNIKARNNFSAKVRTIRESLHKRT